jgi:hypothetical protein
MCTTLLGVDIVHKGEESLVVPVVVLQCKLKFNIILESLEIYGFRMKRLPCLIEIIYK